jgi:pyruvate/2-oxoglutarate dehydrogenase complex dihydrolipoamide acyltransferase (E2) component
MGGNGGELSSFEVGTWNSEKKKRREKKKKKKKKKKTNTKKKKKKKKKNTQGCEVLNECNGTHLVRMSHEKKHRRMRGIGAVRMVEKWAEMVEN